MVNCGFCTGATGLKDTDQIVEHIRTQHLIVPGDDIATTKNLERLAREVAKYWQQNEG